MIPKNMRLHTMLQLIKGGETDFERSSVFPHNLCEYNRRRVDFNLEWSTLIETPRILFCSEKLGERMSFCRWQDKED